LHQSFLKIIHPCLLYNIAQKFQLFRKISGAFVGFSCDVILLQAFRPLYAVLAAKHAEKYGFSRTAPYFSRPQDVKSA